MHQENTPLLDSQNSPNVAEYGSGVDASSSSSDSEGFHCHGLSKEERKSNKKAIRILWISVGVCLIFMICEAVGGLLAGSLAILTDAAHLLTDLASMLISLFSLYIANRPASHRMSFGWHRAEVVGAFISVFLIWIVTGVLVYLAIERIITGNYEIEGPIMAITAAIGVCVNIIMGLLLYFGGHSHSHGGASHGHKHSHEDGQNINVRAAFVHVLGDLLQSVGVLIASLLILFNDRWAVADPICTLLFSVIVLCTTIYIIKDTLLVLLEGRPSSIDFLAVFDSLQAIPNVRKVHDLRIWALTMDKVAISVHLEIEDHSSAQSVLKNTTVMLKEKYGVHESTVQIEGYTENASCNQCIPLPNA
ncbi:hypothetical protein L596_015714 [Steinernema carpocapsae]|uniref:Cation efflux protein cytoplasmic domain-containing protein n=1 Tax=Steinernema carpocapsae TaxID=34508 RepID=A0A4U5NFY8_STECR|nr:hypothetical protein L596_015714 [Steinernema carpocapsae]